MVNVSIVLITWNIRELIVQCISSIKEHTKDIIYEIIVVDNDSMDGTADYIRRHYPDINLIVNDKNYGVAFARNQGMKCSKGKYIFILDADTVLLENSILSLYRFMEKDPLIGITGAKLVDEELNLQYSSRRFPSVLAILSRRLKIVAKYLSINDLSDHMMYDWDHNSVRDVDYIIGANQFIRAAAVQKIGFYDENIFYGPEDLDYCLRMWRNGYKVMYYPFTSIFHLEQRITKKKFHPKLFVLHTIGIYYLFNKYNWKLKREQ